MIQKVKHYDYVVIGAGIYGLYSTMILSAKEKNVLLLEIDKSSCSRASLINQARVHNGYHYPRSLSTAIKSASYFNKFSEEFGFAINNKFSQIYSISKELSYTSSDQFQNFCKNANIPCKEVRLNNILNPEYIEASFETKEYGFDATKINAYFLNKLEKLKNVTISYCTYPKTVKQRENYFLIELNTNVVVKTNCVINTTYASTNQVAKIFGFDKFKLKYEICEVIICDVSTNFRNMGITVMDGPFFSLMPFGINGHHSLTSVTFTPQRSSYDVLPTFECQNNNINCSPECLQNCNHCKYKPNSSWVHMNQMTKKYLLNVNLTYIKSFFAIKPTLLSSELDDSRPTIIKELSKKPKFISVLSGKINTIYDLDKVLRNL